MLSRRLPGRLRSGRWLVGVVALAALVVAAVLLLSLTTAPQGRRISSIFEDDALLVDPPLTPAGNATVTATLATLKHLGVDRIRVLVEWDTVAPPGTVKPAGFDASDPGDYPDTATNSWAPFDRIDLAAHADGIGVYFDLSSPAPAWASTPQPSDTRAAGRQYALQYLPSASDFEQFVEAAGRRYSGSYAPAGAGGRALPRVSFWSVWNEPNQPGWLAPQENPRTNRALAPALYRGLVDGFWTGLARSGHNPARDTILVGELAPTGCVSDRGCVYARAGEDYAALPPLTFLEDLYCVGPAGHAPSTTSVSPADLQMLSGVTASERGCPASGNAGAFVAANPGLFRATGLAEHPYSFFLAPDVSDASASDSAFAPLSDLSRLTTTIDAIFSVFGQGAQLPLYLTEYGYVSNPPNPNYLVTPALQAKYLDEAEYMAVQNPRVRAMAQFELQDTNPALACGCAPTDPHYWDNFESGLEYLGGAHKPAYAAYALPIFLPGLESGPGLDAAPVAPDTPTEVWGMLRAAPAGSTQRAQIQWRGGVGTVGGSAAGSTPTAGGGGSAETWRTLATTTTRDPSGILSASVVIPGTGEVRLAWTPSGGGTTELSRAVAVTVR